MVSEGFPENHDNPTKWPYWSASHRHIKDLAAEHAPEVLRNPKNRSPEDTRIIEMLERSDSESMEETLAEIDDEIELLRSSIEDALHHRGLLNDVLAKRIENRDR